jgi:hypothetical protein
MFGERARAASASRSGGSSITRELWSPRSRRIDGRDVTRGVSTGLGRYAATAHLFAYEFRPGLMNIVLHLLQL